MAEQISERFTELLAGRLSRDDIPAAKATMIRMYVCSAGTDSVTERDYFVERVYPRLRAYCKQKYGLEFQVVDPNWGVLADTTDNQADLTRVRTGEIRKCQALSAGPDLIVFLGQKYGARRLPDVILPQEFDAIQGALRSHKGRVSRNAALLEQCYRLDENSVPPVYVLQHTTTLNREEVRGSAPKTWAGLQAELRRLLQGGAQLAYQDGTMDLESRDRFFLSDLEHEVLQGVESGDDPSRRCVLITRNIQDLKNYTHDPRLTRFAEVTFNARTGRYDLDPDSANMLVKLKNRLSGLVPREHTIHHEVLWRYEDVIDCSHHREYLDALCEQLFSITRSLIDAGVRVPDNGIPRACQEAATHWSRCGYLASNFYNQDAPLTQLRQYVTGPLATPLVVYGASGTGKSKIVSKLAFEIKELLAGGDFVVVLRYISPTFSSTDIGQVLISLCTQLDMAMETHPSDLPTDMADLVKYFTDLLARTPASCRLVLILDGVEQLLPDHGALNLTWIPLEHPVNVKLILTVHDTTHGLLDRLRLELLPDRPQSFLEIGAVGVAACELIFTDTLLAMNRSLTAEQKGVFRDVIGREPLPLFVEMLVNVAKDIPSFTDAGSIQLPGCCQEAIWQFLNKLEAKHGTLLVSRAFAYLVASSSGLSDCEMEDILSLDEDVLNEVFKDSQPAIRRLPCIKWLSLKQDVQAFLAHRDSDGVTVAAWRHDSFHDAVNTRYLSEATVVTLVHCNIADYFLRACSHQPHSATPLNSDKPVSAGTETGRNLARQYQSAMDKQGDLVKFSKRMYEQVPRHLGLAGRYQELDASVCFNYEWLFNKIRTLSVQSVLADLALSPSQEAGLVARVLQAAAPDLERDIHNLPALITGHLLPYFTSHSNIRALIHQCDTVGLQHCALVPNFPYQTVPGSALEFSLKCPTEVDQLLLLHDDRQLLCKGRDELYIYKFDLDTGDHKADVFASIGELHSTPNGKYFIIVDHITEKSMKIHDAESGDFIKQIIIMNHLEGKSYLYKKGPLCVSDDRLCAVVTLSNSLLCVCEIPSGNVLNIIPLDGKSHVCSLKPDSNFVFCNSNSSLLAFDVYRHTHLLTVPLGGLPAQLLFSQDGLRAFIRNDADAKVTVMHLSGETVDLTYRMSFDDKMPGDSIRSLIASPDDSSLLLRGDKHLVVYGRGLERVVAIFKKPGSIPEDCKLPHSHQVALHFTQAEFTGDSKCVLATIFRSVYLWQISDGRLVSVLQAPVGLVTSMLVSRSRGQVLTHLDNSREIQVWRPGRAVQQLITPDKLTDAIAEFHVTVDTRLTFIKCCRSDAVGVIDLNTGCLRDLLTHDTDVQDLAISPDGSWALVATPPRLKGTAFKLWNMEERHVVMETGDVVGYCVGMNSSPYIIMVAQKSPAFRSAYQVSIIDVSQSEHQVHERTATDITVIRSKPFVTYSDQYLVIHSSADWQSSESTVPRPCLHLVPVQGEMPASVWDASNMQFEDHLQDILQVRPCRHENKNLVAAVFSCVDHRRPHSTESRNSGQSGQPPGFFLLDISVGSLTLLCIPFLKASYDLSTQPLIFSPDFSFCLDEMSNIFHTSSGEFIGQVTHHVVPPRAFALRASVVVYYTGCTLRLVRLSDGHVIANCQVSAPICHIHVCSDERTILVGCEDGAVLSYTAIDPRNEHAELIARNIASRKSGSPDMVDRSSTRSWDKMAGSPAACPPLTDMTPPSDQPLLDHGQPSLHQKQPSLDHEQPSLDHKQPSLDHKQPLLDHKQPSLDHRQPSLDHKQSMLDHRQPSLDQKQPSLDHEQPLLDHEQVLLDHNQPSLDHKQPSLDHKQPILDHRQPSLDQKQPSLDH
ncbi:hypothetical protein BsWGS_03189 [Bradybaena similaris]